MPQRTVTRGPAAAGAEEPAVGADEYADEAAVGLVDVPAAAAVDQCGLAHLGAPGPVGEAGPGRGGAPCVPAMKLMWMTASFQLPASRVRMRVARAASGMGWPR